MNKTKLYELSGELIELESRLEEYLTDESISDEDRELKCERLLSQYLENEGKFIEKLDNCLRYANELNRLAEVRKDEAKRLTNLAAQSKNRSEDLKKYVLNHLLRTGKTKLETDNHKIYVKKGVPKVVVDIPPEQLPEEYKRVKVEPDKIAIKKALKETNTAIHNMAHIEESNDYSLIIK